MGEITKKTSEFIMKCNSTMCYLKPSTKLFDFSLKYF